MDDSQDELEFIIANAEITLLLDYANFSVLAFLVYDTRKL